MAYVGECGTFGHMPPERIVNDSPALLGLVKD